VIEWNLDLSTFLEDEGGTARILRDWLPELSRKG
jgi:hypothetical protein